MKKEQNMEQKRYCKYCKKLLTPKIYESGRKESINHLSKRTYCNRECMQNDYKGKAFGNVSLWSKDEEEMLKKEYENKTDIKIIAKKMGKTPASIKAKAHDMNITDKSKYYTQEQINFIIKNKDLLTYKDLSKFLGKSEANICRKMKELGITKKKIKSKYWENITPKQKEARKLKQRETKIKNGTLNPMRFQKNPYSRAKSGKREDLNNTYFRSAWEANIARYYNYIGIKWEYEPKTFIFENIKRGSVSYTPDFYLPEEDKWIEIKGYMDSKSKTKLKRFARQYPEEYKKLELIQQKEYNEIKRKMSGFIKNWE